MPNVNRIPPTMGNSLVLSRDFDAFFKDPDPSLPIDFWDRQKQGQSHDPNKDMWLGVLEQAYEDYQNNYPEKNREFREVFNWFFNDTTEELGSFNYICNILGANKIMLLKPLINWTKKGKKVTRDEKAQIGRHHFRKSKTSL